MASKSNRRNAPVGESAEPYRSIVAAMSDGVIFQDCQGRIQFCNPSAERILELPAREILGKTFDDLPGRAIREDGSPFQNNEHPAMVTLRTGQPSAGILGLIRPDSSITWISTNAEPLCHPGESVPYSVVMTFSDVTRQRNAEVALAQSEKLFRTLVENQGEGAGIVDLDERFLFANPAGEEIFGVKPGGLVGRCVLDFVSPRHASLIRAETRVRMSGKTSVYELEIVRESDRTTRMVLVSATPQFDDSGNVSATFGVFRDITDRKRAETALQESEERLRLAAETNRLGTFDIDWKTGKRVWSLLAKQIFGFGPDVDVTFDDFIGAVHEDDRERVRAEVRGMLDPQSAPKSRSEFRIVRIGDRQERWISSWGRTFFDEEGRPVRLIGITQDITELRRAEEALRESEARLRLTFDQAPVGALLVGLDFRFLRVNDTVCRFLGYSAEELMGMNLPDITHPDYWDSDREHARLLEEGKLDYYRIDKRYLRKDGTVVWGHLTVRLLKDESGKGLYFVSIVEDITERKKAEEEHEKLQAQLQQARKMESIGRLAGGVAHDFNNLLTVINGYSSLAMNRLRPLDPLYEPIGEVYRAGEAAAVLVRQLLAFSRKQLLRQERLDLNQMIVNLEKTLLPLLGEHIEIVTELQPSLDAVLADRNQIEQVILNLAVNARDAMPEGGVLTVETVGLTAGPFCSRCLAPMRTGNYVRVTVRDTGFGMDEETRQHLFEPFFSTKDAGQGTGLGLAMVHGIIVQSGGHIDVESAPGQGASFHIYLPAVEARKETPRAPGVEAATEEPARGTETILLVEDQPEVRRFVATVLQECGYRVLLASSAEEASSQCAVETVDLLLTDVVLPKMSGWELANLVRSYQPRVKVLFMSGYSEEMLAGKTDGLRGVTLIQKPFSPDMLAEKVRLILKDRAS